MIRFAALIGLMVFCIARAQTNDPPTFEVAEIKINTSPGRNSHFNSDNGRLIASGVTMRDYIRFAHDLKDYQVIGPKTIETDKYDVIAKALTSVPERELMAMLQTLLTSRFHLVSHMEKRDLPVYELVVAKNGPKIHAVEVEGDHSSSGTRGKLVSKNVDMANLTQHLSRLMDRPVIDKTALPGRFTFTLEWDAAEDLTGNRPARPGEAAGAADSTAPSLLSALQQQLGLKLEMRKAPLDVMVIDSVERVPVEK